MGRRQAREAALKALFQVELGGAQPEFALKTVCAEDKLSPAEGGFAKELVTGVLAKLEELDAHLERFSNEWSVERMATIDRLTLRLACYELLYRSDIPMAVSINEAVELAKKYSTPEAGRFVNGLLSAVARNQPLKDGRL